MTSGQPALLDGSAHTRRVVVTPSMCGSTALIFGQLGDWTWEAVQAACRTNVYVARNAEGQPTYLSFYYFHVAASARFHPHSLGFGDELDVTSRVFDFGRHSVLTLHRVSRAGSDRGTRALEPDEFYLHPRDDCLYVENLNRWVARGRPRSNQGLVESSPVGFQHTHLPALPSAYSPRGLCGTARRHATFFPRGVPGHTVVAPDYRTTYPLDVVRDLNGAGLTYFAAYFAIVDTALLRMWRELGRTDREFLARRVLDHRLAYFGNVDAGTTFAITLRLWRRDSDSRQEVADVALHEAGTGRLLGVAGIALSRDES